MKDDKDDIVQAYYDLREKYLKQIDSCYELEEKIFDYERIIEKMTEELQLKTWLVNEYIMSFGDRAFEIIERKYKRTHKKNSNDEGEEL